MVTIRELKTATKIARRDSEDTICRRANDLETCVLREAMSQAERQYDFCHFRPRDNSVEIAVVNRLKESLRDQGFFVCDKHEYEHGGGIWFSWDSEDAGDSWEPTELRSVVPCRMNGENTVWIFGCPDSRFRVILYKDTGNWSVEKELNSERDWWWSSQYLGLDFLEVAKRMKECGVGKLIREDKGHEA